MRLKQLTQSSRIWSSIADGDNQNNASGAQIERNKRFASALGVQPSGQRPLANSGRFYGSDGKGGTGDDFELEVNVTMYAENLLKYAKENLGFVMKLERRWCEFIADRNAPSCQLSPMVRETRLYVHNYSDFWKLHTER